MNDRTLLNNGKSSKMKTPTLPETYAEFKAACDAGTQFCDITPNDSTGADAGVANIGTALNTANILSNNTAQALGLTSSATPNDAFQEIANWEVVNTITFATTDWAADSGAYKAVKNVNGVTANSKPIPSLHYSTMVEATCKNEAKAYSKIIKFETASGTITAWAYSVPAVAVSVDFKGI